MAGGSYHWTDNIGVEPYEEERRMKRWEEINMPCYIADAQYGIPTSCPCGGEIKQDASPTPKFRNDFDTLPGRRYFTCTKFKDDGLHFRQPWVFGVEEEIRKLVRKVDEQSKKIEEMQKEIESQAQEIRHQAQDIETQAVEIARLNMLL